MGLDSNIAESIDDLFNVLLARGARAFDGEREFAWMTVAALVDHLAFADPAPSPSMVKARATLAIKHYELTDDDLGWCSSDSWPELALNPAQPVVYVATDIQWSPA